MTARVPLDWPNREASQTRRGPVHDWHFQKAGTAGPNLLLLHGAGGSVHSFRDLFPVLALTNTVLAPDLPGHGFTKLGAQRRSGLEAMADDIGALCDELEFEPDWIVGHSAGGAIALEIAHHRPDTSVMGLNAALGHFEGLAGFVFPAMAKLLAAVPFTARMFSATSANPTRIKALIDSTGSEIDETGLALYRRLVAQESHVAGALAMMAQWSLDGLLTDLSQITNDCHFLTGSKDKTVPPAVSEHAAERLANADVTMIDGLGHLMHEENPEKLAGLIQHCLETKMAAHPAMHGQGSD